MRSLFFVVIWMLSYPLSAQNLLVEKPEFRSLVSESTALEKLATGFKFLEGPAWDPLTHTLIFSDIPADRLYRFDPATPAVAPQIFRDPSNHANGNTYDAHGNLYTCEHGTRHVTRTNPAGAVETLVDRYEGKLFNSPNDIAIQPDGTVWFTDPTYGLGKRPQELPDSSVFSFDPSTRELLVDPIFFDQPNGLCFSPDGSRFYVADSGKPHNIIVFDLDAKKHTSSMGRVFCVIEPGVPDGIRCDPAGNLWSTAGDGIHVYNPAGERLGKILVPETPANLCFGGPDGRDLYITARTSLYRVRLLLSATP